MKMLIFNDHVNDEKKKKSFKITRIMRNAKTLTELLFIILINDLTESITSSVKLFADDCLFYRTIHSSNAIQLRWILFNLDYG